MTEDIIEINGKKYTHRSGSPKRGQLVLVHDDYMGNDLVSEVCADYCPNDVRVILTPVVEPGPWDNDGTYYGEALVKQCTAGTLLQFCTPGYNPICIPIVGTKFLLDAVKQAKSMGIIKEYVE